MDGGVRLRAVFPLRYQQFYLEIPSAAQGFLAGTLLLGAAMGLDLYHGVLLQEQVGLWHLAWGAAGGLFLALLLYALFFALPFGETYCAGEPAEKARPYDRDVYALCRHPGVLFLAGVYLCWGMAVLPGDLLRNGMIFSLLNVLYVVFQDLVTFPAVFEDYTGYRRKVPFLVPTRASVRTAWATRRFWLDKEENA